MEPFFWGYHIKMTSQLKDKHILYKTRQGNCCMANNTNLNVEALSNLLMVTKLEDLLHPLYCCFQAPLSDICNSLILLRSWKQEGLKSWEMSRFNVRRFKHMNLINVMIMFVCPLYFYVMVFLFPWCEHAWWLCLLHHEFY